MPACPRTLIVTCSLRVVLIVLTISSLVALPRCEPRDKSATDLVGAKYVAYRKTLLDFEVRAYVLVVDPGPGGYLETENKLINVSNSLSNAQRLTSAMSVLATYNGSLKQAADEMDDHLEKLRNANLAVIEAVHRLPGGSGQNMRARLSPMPIRWSIRQTSWRAAFTPARTCVRNCCRKSSI